MGYVLLLVLVLAFGLIWMNMARRPRPKARIGPDGTNVHDPESLVVHHEGKAESLDIANTALKEHSARDASRTAMEVAREVSPPARGPEQTRLGTAADRGRTAKGPGDADDPGVPVEQPEAQDEVTDIPNGAMPATQVIAFEPEFEIGEEMISFSPDPTIDWSALREADDLPPEYCEDSVTAIVRNPRSLYVYWECSGPSRQRLRQMLGEPAYQASTPCLRVFDTATDSAFTIDLSEQDDHWFVQNLEPGHRYVVSYERRSPDGRYYLIALSDPVTTPLEGSAGTGMLYHRLGELANPGSSRR